MLPTDVGGRRGLQGSDRQGAGLETDTDLDQTASTVVSPTVDPLQSELLEKHMLDTSGLLDVRPPIAPGKTGENVTHAIPFQSAYDTAHMN